MNYPQELVHQYGAKAGILMYVAGKLPDIPQAKMIVKSPNESVEDVLRRADESGISWPRIFRSSAVVELDGYEGDFPTVVIEDFETKRAEITNSGYVGTYSRRDLFDAHVYDTISKVENSPQDLKQDGKNEHLPDKINVIIAEKSPSEIVGTYIKHPNQDGLYLISCSIADSVDSTDPLRSNYSFRSEEGVRDIRGFSHGRVEQGRNFRAIARELEEVISWYEKIVSLPQMDQDWSYQVEFGLSPMCLYQVRPFKRKEKADFAIEESSDEVVVIGITPKGGINVRVVSNVYHKWNHNTSINPSGEPVVFVDPMRSAQYVDQIPNHQANLFSHGAGFLAHSDVKAMRSAQVTALFGDDSALRDYKDGERINIVSDGKNVKVTRI